MITYEKTARNAFRAQLKSFQPDRKRMLDASQTHEIVFQNASEAFQMHLKCIPNCICNMFNAFGNVLNALQMHLELS